MGYYSYYVRKHLYVEKEEQKVVLTKMCHVIILKDRESITIIVANFPQTFFLKKDFRNTLCRRMETKSKWHKSNILFLFLSLVKNFHSSYAFPSFISWDISRNILWRNLHVCLVNLQKLYSYSVKNREVWGEMSSKGNIVIFHAISFLNSNILSSPAISCAWPCIPF